MSLIKPIFRVRLLFKGGGEVTFKARSFAYKGNTYTWTRNGNPLTEQVLRFDADQVAAATYHLCGFTL